jgi:hypothetical protein
MVKYSIELLSDEEKLIQFKQNALAQAQKFNINNIIPMYEKLYAAVLNKKG